MFDENEKNEKREETTSCFPSYKKFVEMYDESLMHVHDDTVFWVHGRRFHFCKLSLGIFHNRTQIRFFLVWIVTSKKFENGVISLIILNSIILGLKDYTDPDNKTFGNRLIESFEPLFTYSFIIECISKILAMGFILGKSTYLSEAWNWLDFIVVVSSLLE